MNLLARFPPHLTIHTTFGETLCVAFGVHTPHAINPNTYKGAWGLSISQLESTNW
jgi:hypothetical protein